MPNSVDKRFLSQSKPFETERFQGHFNSAFNVDDVKRIIPSLHQTLQSNDVELIAGGRNQNVRIVESLDGREQPILVKSFGSQSRWKDRVDLGSRLSKAQRSFVAASHLLQHEVGTPIPIAFGQSVSDGRIVESYYLTIYKQECCSFHEALLYLLHNQSTASSLMPLLEQVAVLCRRMHDAGFIHNDLGNQNILLSIDPDSNWSDSNWSDSNWSDSNWKDACVIDLNRGRIHSELSLMQRGADLSRLSVPSNLMAMFLDMYWGAPVPRDLQASYERHARRFALRARTRKLRHPFREARIARESALLPSTDFMPAPRDLWIWDDTSDQALSPLDRRERVREYPSDRSWRLLKDTLSAALPVWREYRKTKAAAFSEPVAMKGRVGIALEPDNETLQQELRLLDALGNIPVLVRCCHHESSTNIDFQIALVKQLHQLGHAVTLALVQDRRAILEPDSWQNFVSHVLSQLAPCIVAVEYGHAINRVKWGIWNFVELRRFYQPLADIARQYPDLRIIGPATIDFEYPFLLAALRDWPKSVAMAALSHHLYVDRRGAPENPQNGFSALEKFALAKSIATGNPKGESEVIVSEVNWPVAGAGIHSPVTAPFTYRDAPAGSLHDSGETEENCAYYTIRYLALALGSGLVSQVFWWRLVARGYGLVDVDAGEVRERPAYRALQHFINTVNDAEAISAIIPNDSKSNEGRYLIQFRRAGGELFWLCWQHGSPGPFPEDLIGERVEDLFGNTLQDRPVELQGSPIYIRNCAA